MTEAEVWSFLRAQRHVQFGSNGPRGWPHIVPLSYALVDNCLAVQGYDRSQKVFNVRRDPHVTCLVETGDTYATRQGVLVEGRAEVVEDRSTVEDVVRVLLETEHVMAPIDIDRLVAKRVALVVRPERFVSWDHRKLAGAY